MRVVLVSLMVAAVTLAGCNRNPPAAEPAVGQRVADTFLAQVRAGQLDAAWQSTTAEFKSDEGRESFIRDVKFKPALRGALNFVSYEVIDLNGLKRGQCIYESAASKTPATRVRIVVAQDAGDWRVEGMFVE